MTEERLSQLPIPQTRQHRGIKAKTHLELRAVLIGLETAEPAGLDMLDSRTFLTALRRNFGSYSVGGGRRLIHNAMRRYATANAASTHE